MSRKLLSHLNGNNDGRLKEFLDNFEGEPRIAWYPSAGEDYHPLLYFPRRFSEPFRARGEQQSPDLFLFTDYFPWKYSTFLERMPSYSERSSGVTIEYIEELPRLNLSLHKRLVRFENGGRRTDRAVFLEVKISSSYSDSYSCRILYAFAENTIFFYEKLVPYEAKISHIIHTNYGAGCGGGGSSTGVWLKNVLRQLHCEFFITDGQETWLDGDLFALELCPSIPKESNVQLTPLNGANRQGRAGGGGLSWYSVT